MGARVPSVSGLRTLQINQADDVATNSTSKTQPSCLPETTKQIWICIVLYYNVAISMTPLNLSAIVADTCHWRQDFLAGSLKSTKLKLECSRREGVRQSVGRGQWELGRN